MSLRFELAVERLTANPLFFTMLKVPLGKVLEPWLEGGPTLQGKVTSYRLVLEDGEVMALDFGPLSRVQLEVDDGEVLVTVPRVLGPSLRAALGAAELVRGTVRSVTYAPRWRAGSTALLPTSGLGVAVRLTLLGAGGAS
ncbi:MAG: hypothetical protein EP330_08620 [Deltaproteobacteria bacterium]|nr:MAG: hypothetical protein EP330_08620 [Deltaproteobacteria bacterium]